MGSYIARVYSSERLSSSHGPDIFYELVHAHVKHDPAQAVGADVVIIRMVQGDRADLGIVPEIHVKDLMEVEERFLLFMDRVRKKSGDTVNLQLQHPGSQISPVPGVPVLAPQMPMMVPMMPQMPMQPMPAPAPTPTPAPAPAPVPAAAAPAPEPEPMGRYDPRAPRRKISGMPEGMMSTGPKKSSFSLGPGGQILGKAPGDASSTWRAPGDDGGEPGGMSGYEILPFTLQKPPDLDQVMRLLSNDPQRLVVVARTELTDKIKTYLDNVIKGDGTLAQKPGAFSAIVVNRQGGKMNFKQKMQGPIALALQQIVANPTKVLWVPPEGA